MGSDDSGFSLKAMPMAKLTLPKLVKYVCKKLHEIFIMATCSDSHFIAMYSNCFKTFM